MDLSSEIEKKITRIVDCSLEEADNNISLALMLINSANTKLNITMTCEETHKISMQKINEIRTALKKQS